MSETLEWHISVDNALRFMKNELEDHPESSDQHNSGDVKSLQEQWDELGKTKMNVAGPLVAFQLEWMCVLSGMFEKFLEKVSDSEKERDLHRATRRELKARDMEKMARNIRESTFHSMILSNNQ